MFDTEFFISIVKSHPVIWDRSSPDVNYNESKIEGWNNIGEKMCTDWHQISNAEKNGRGEVLLSFYLFVVGHRLI